jgi:hypothetical protein
MPIWDIGDVARLRARFTDLAGAYADPTTVTATIRSPSGITTNYVVPPIVNDPALVGGFYLDLTLNEAGLWTYKFIGTGAVVALDEETLRVRPSVIGASKAPCQTWVDVATVADCCTVTDAGELEIWVQVATDVLHVLSGRQFTGACTKTIRPCEVVCGCSCHGYGWPGSWYGSWSTLGLVPSRPRCCPPQIDLGGKVAGITSVKVDGETLASSEYRLDGGRWLVRLTDASGGNEGWPCCQRLDLASTEECTFEIAYLTESDVPEMGARAVAELACELAKSCSTVAGECRLPKRVTNLTRQGVTMTLLDPMQFLDGGKTGLYLPDLFLATVNPSGLRAPPRVLTPDVMPHRRIG